MDPLPKNPEQDEDGQRNWHPGWRIDTLEVDGTIGSVGFASLFKPSLWLIIWVLAVHSGFFTATATFMFASSELHAGNDEHVCKSGFGWRLGTKGIATRPYY